MSGPLGVLATLVLFVVVLGSLVLIHELGHFITARLAGIRVLEFGIGFPPRAKVLRSSGETLYTLNWLPIGGFVKLEGEDGDDTSDPRSFSNASLPKRVVILLAGVAMNLFLAFAIFTLIAWLATPYLGLRFAAVQPGSPASGAGLRPGDALLAVNGEQHEFLAEGDVLTDLRSRTGETVTLTIQHADGSIAPVSVKLRSQAEIDAAPKDEQGRPTIGWAEPTRTPPTSTDTVGRRRGLSWSVVGMAGRSGYVLPVRIRTMSKPLTQIRKAKRKANPTTYVICSARTVIRVPRIRFRTSMRIRPPSRGGNGRLFTSARFADRMPMT
jgi:membrane-associated protease RseP (regulator of RpoE activity)